MFVRTFIGIMYCPPSKRESTSEKIYQSTRNRSQKRVALICWIETWTLKMFFARSTCVPTPKRNSEEEEAVLPRSWNKPLKIKS